MDNNEEVKVARLEEQMKFLNKGLDSLGLKIDGLTDKIDNNYVKKEDFKPVKDEVDKLKFLWAKVTGFAAAAALIVDLVIRFLTKN